MGRPKRETTLFEKLLKSEVVEYSDYSQKSIVECIGQLVAKVNEKKEGVMSDTELKGIKTNLETQIAKIDKVLAKETESNKEIKEAKENAVAAPTEPTNASEPANTSEPDKEAK